jgi:hypothetical protein
MTPDVERAIAEIQQAFPGNLVEIQPDPNGGAYITVQDLAIGDQYTPSKSWVGFQITFQYPHADVYPHYINGTVRRVDGQAYGAGMQLSQSWQGRDAVMVSRRSNRWNAAVDTAAMKLAKILTWISSQ